MSHGSDNISDNQKQKREKGRDTNITFLFITQRTKKGDLKQGTFANENNV